MSEIEIVDSNDFTIPANMINKRNVIIALEARIRELEEALDEIENAKGKTHRQIYAIARKALRGEG